MSNIAYNCTCGREETYRKQMASYQQLVKDIEEVTDKDLSITSYWLRNKIKPFLPKKQKVSEKLRDMLGNPNTNTTLEKVNILVSKQELYELVKKVEDLENGVR